MVEELRTISRKKPTFLNKSLEIGVLAGLCAIPIGVPWGISGMRSALSAGILGGCIGSALEERQMQNDLKFGKKVKMPTFWNRDFLLGGLKGIIAGSIIESALLPTGGLFTIASAVAGATAGGKSGKKEMQENLNRATAERKIKNSGALIHQGKTLDFSVEQAQAMETNFSTKIEQERVVKNNLTTNTR